jgi:hypothetical protein
VTYIKCKVQGYTSILKKGIIDEIDGIQAILVLFGILGCKRFGFVISGGYDGHNE